MLIGADFFLSHRIYVASSQRKLYFTYNGGPVFNLDTPGAATTAGAAESPRCDPEDAAPPARLRPRHGLRQPADARLDEPTDARASRAAEPRSSPAETTRGRLPI